MAMRKRIIFLLTISLLCTIFFDSALATGSTQMREGIVYEGGQVDDTDMYDTLDDNDRAAILLAVSENTVSATTIVSNALSLIDQYPYVWGGESPSEGGFDCSGLVWYVYNQMSGVNISLSQAGRSKSALLNAGAKIIGISNFMPGDIVQFDYAHVAIYIGNSTIVEAAKAGTRIRTRTINSNSQVDYAIRLPAIIQDSNTPENPGGSQPHVHSTIRKGSTGTCVIELQTALNRFRSEGWLTWDGDTLAVDGDFGDATEKALRAFQDNQKITSDGVCGDITWGYVENPVKPNLYVDVGTDFYAYIINTKSWLHLSNDGDNNVTARTGDADNQIWHFERLEGGAYKITSLMNRNQCLDVENFGQASGTNVGVSNDNGGSAQRWYIYGENAAYEFRAECTDCFLDITNSNYVPGVNVQMWERNGTDAQKFQIWNLGSPSKTLDINWMLDGNQVWGEQEYGTVDVYINGVLDADDVTDYCKEFPMGTRYEITDIKAKEGHISQGVHSGSLSGMLVHDSVEVWISFATLANLGVNGWLDGQYTGGLGTDAFNYATVDVYINGELKADDVSYYYVGWPVGTTYEIKDIKANPGYAYVGIHNGTLSGTIGADHANVAFDFATVHYLDLSSYLDEAYSGNLGDYGTVDVYINGVLVKDDVTDYYAELPVGTTYEIKDAKPRAGRSYNGIRAGTRTGSIGSENVAVVFDFSNIQTSNLPSASKQETFNGHTYKFYSDAVTWYTAKLLCESMGGHLVTITSKEEDQFIKSFSDGKYAHIGATDANSEGYWEWVNGEPFSYENWIAPPDNYPINDEGCENYAHIRDDGLWNDFPGYITYPFICEFDSVEPTQHTIINSANRNENTVTVNVVCADSNALVFCAAYNNSGKMIAVSSAQITSESNYQFQFDGQQFDYAKAFIVDSDLRPLCESKRS